MTGPSVEKCCAACAKLKDCTGWTLAEARCWMKRGGSLENHKTPATGLTSGRRPLRPEEAHRNAHEQHGGPKPGSLNLDEKELAAVRNYSRVLDMASAVSRVSYVEEQGGRFAVHVQRDSFVSAAHQVLVVRTTTRCMMGGGSSSKCAAAANVSASLSRLIHANTTASIGEAGDGRAACWLTLRGRVRMNEGVHFTACAAVMSEEGGVVLALDRIAGGGAQRCVAAMGSTSTVVLAIVTSFRDESHAATCEQTVRSATALPYEELRRHHIAAHAKLFKRVDFELNTHASSSSSSNDTLLVDLTTPELLRRAGSSGNAAPSATTNSLPGVVSGAAALLLVPQYFAFGRYLTIAASRGDRGAAQPMNLQGESFYFMIVYDRILH